MKRASSLLPALILLGLAANAQAQARNCLTHDEASALIGYALPDLLAGLKDKCRPSLAAGSFLNARSAEMEIRYRAQSDSLWPQAKAAFVKMVGDDKTLAKMPDSAVRPFLAAAFATVIVEDIDESDCRTVDGVVEMLSPLPPQNLARLIGIIIAADDEKSDSAGKSEFEICE